MKDKFVSSLKHVLEHAQGKTTGGRVTRVEPPRVDVLKIRKRLGLSQTEFAMHYGFSVATLRNWEQGRRQPEGPARVLLKVIERHPETVEAALQDEGD